MTRPESAPSVENLRRDPNALASHYSRFRVGERLLLTGHSHQAWPDAARDGQLEAFDAAAEAVDGKWDRAFEKAERVRRGFADWLGDRSGTLALEQNTHDLLVRFLSALPLESRPRLVTTDGEFHTIRRQLQRLEEVGIEVVRVASQDAETLAERLAAEVDDRTAAVLCSTVLFHDSRIVPGLSRALAAAQTHGAELLLDTYHHLAVVPCDLEGDGLGDAFAVGGGYKYCQLGEGNCFLRVPPGRNLRPILTGWFAEFEDLSEAPAGATAYGQGAAAFAGATYDPTSHFRAASVFDFFEYQGLDAEFLRRVSQHQIARLIDGFDRLDADPDRISRAKVPREQLGGFLTLRSKEAGRLCSALLERGVRTDVRGECLRFGPAPYLSDRQLDDSIRALGEALRS